MLDKFEQIISLLKQEFAKDLESCNIEHDELTVVVNNKNIIKVLDYLKTNSELHFEQLIDLSGVDYSTYGATEWETNEATSNGFSRGVEITKSSLASKVFKERFAVVYHLLSLKHNFRIRVRSFADDSSGIPMIDSAVDIWNGADWFEREAFDMFGIVFNGHPDLRRILTDYGFIGHPFRKDFPLTGHVEIAYDENEGKVVYQPVSIEPRVLVPRVIRRDDRYDDLEQMNNN